MKTSLNSTELTKKERSKFWMKKGIVVLLFLCIITSGVFGTTPTTTTAAADMAETVGKVADFFGSGWVKGICCICLIGECLGLLFAGGQNPQIFKKFLPFIIGTVLFMCAGKIVNLIFGDSTISFSTSL